MTIEKPLWLGPHPTSGEVPEYSAQADRAILATLFTEGVGNVPAGELLVTQRAAGAAMSVEVAAGVGYITGDDVPRQGLFRTVVTATETVPIPAAPAANSRIDLVVLRTYDAAAVGGVKHGTYLEVVQGVVAASPTAPAVPPTAMALAQVLVAAGVPSIVTANITDLRSQAGAKELKVGIRVQKDVFTASGIWTKPDGAKLVKVILFGGGGSGGAGPTAGGGAGGERLERDFVADLLPSTVAVAVGAGGTPRQVDNGVNWTSAEYSGNPGSGSTFGAATDSHYMRAGGGCGGRTPYNSVGTFVAMGGAGGRDGYGIRIDQQGAHFSLNEMPWRMFGDTNVYLSGLTAFPTPGAGAPAYHQDTGQFGANPNQQGSPPYVQGRLRGLGAPLGGPAGGGAGQGYESTTSVYKAYAAGESGTADRGTGVAGTDDSSTGTTFTAPSGVSRSGTGRAGGGGGSLQTTTPAAGRTKTAGSGGVPAAGGGAVAYNSSTTQGSLVSGAGGRGECIIITIF